MKSRIYFLDNLRTFLIFLVVVIHAGLVYEQTLQNGWIVSDPIKNGSIGLIRMYLDVFVMFTLFFISGYFIPRSVNKQSAGAFIWSKFKRLIIPWLSAALVLIPAYKAIYLYSRGLPAEPWYTYFHTFERSGTDLTFFNNNPVQGWLWFLPILFTFQMVYLVLSKANLKLNITMRTGVIGTLLLSLVYSSTISLAGLTGWHHSGFFHFQTERLIPYFLVFLLGALGAKLDIFNSDKNTRLYIWANIALTISLGIFTATALNLFFNLIDPGRNYFFVSASVDRIAYHFSLLVAMLSFLQILLHAFRFNLNRSNKFGGLLSNYSYSVYINHMIVIGVIAVVMLNWQIPAFAKFGLLTLTTFAVCNLLAYAYDKLVPKNKWVSLETGTLIILGLSSLLWFGNFNAVPSNPETPSKVTAPEMGLHEAVIRGDIKVIQQHIDANSDLNIAEPAGGSSPLISAATFGQTEAATALIKAGADVNFQNKEGSTPLITAAFFCREEIVRALLENGADPKIKNLAGSTALNSVSSEFSEVKGIYEYFAKTYEPMGMKLDLNEVERMRPVIAAILQKYSEH